MTTQVIVDTLLDAIRNTSDIRRTLEERRETLLGELAAIDQALYQYAGIARYEARIAGADEAK